MPSPARLWVNRHKPIVVLLSILLLAASGGFVWKRYQPKPPSPPGRGYFYDVEAKKVFVDDSNKVAPFKTAEGHTAVRANYFTCGGCGDSERFLGHYEKLSDEAVEKVKAAYAANDLIGMASTGGKMISTDGETWVPIESPEGLAITEALNKKCERNTLRYCAPADPAPAKG